MTDQPVISRMHAVVLELVRKLTRCTVARAERCDGAHGYAGCRTVATREPARAGSQESGMLRDLAARPRAWAFRCLHGHAGALPFRQPGARRLRWLNRCRWPLAPRSGGQHARNAKSDRKPLSHVNENRRRGCRKATHGTRAGSQGARRGSQGGSTGVSRAGWYRPRVADEAPAYPSHPRGLTAGADGA